eukprot:5268584-Alexandrium_andersonii.AAC.1
MEVCRTTRVDARVGFAIAAVAAWPLHAHITSQTPADLLVQRMRASLDASRLLRMWRWPGSVS